MGHGAVQVVLVEQRAHVAGAALLGVHRRARRHAPLGELGGAEWVGRPLACRAARPLPVEVVPRRLRLRPQLVAQEGPLRPSPLQKGLAGQPVKSRLEREGGQFEEGALAHVTKNARWHHEP